MVKFWVVWATLKGGDIPLLGKGGVAAHQPNVPVPLKVRTGWFGQLPINRWLERTSPPARAKVASRNFLGRAATPPLPRRGLCPHQTIANWRLNSKVVHYPFPASGRFSLISVRSLISLKFGGVFRRTLVEIVPVL